VFRNAKDYFSLDDRVKHCRFATRAIHAGNIADPIHGGVCPAIDLSTTYKQTAPGETSSCFDYSRCGNPTVLCLQRNLASMEGSKYAFALSTGMSAVISVLSLLERGDHILFIDDLYGGTQRYVRKVYGPQTGIEWEMMDFSDLKKVKKAMKKNTKLVWIESPTNPTLKCTDIAGVSKICKENGAMLVFDNTFMSPVLQNPLALGADICLHSITKYIGGHTDVLGGALCINDDDLYDKLHFNIKTVGTMMAPFDAWIALRGSKTLKLRVEQASANAMVICKWLLKHKKIEKVLYPGLPGHPTHAIAKKNSSDPSKYSGGSGMLGFYIKGDIKDTNKFLSALKMITLAESLGGVESLIESPALMTHGSVPAELRKKVGIDDNYVRMSSGIENVDDIIKDLD